MKHIAIQPDFGDWRTHARAALQQGWAPDEIRFDDVTVETTLPLELVAEDQGPSGLPVPSPHVPKRFLDLAEVAAAHRDPDRWNLLYRILYRLQATRELLKIEIDADVAELHRLHHQVRRDLHKMHAFVRFRIVREDVMDRANPFVPGEDADSTATPPREHFVAWYQPDHHILSAAAPFFAERFRNMNWSVLTPDGSVTWHPDAAQLEFGPGMPREAAPEDDELEAMWRTYYSSIYNPARLNPQAMRQEMPVRYWKNLPEISLLPTLINESAKRVGNMVQTQSAKPSAAPFVPPEHTLPVINAALPTCRGCDLYEHATQVVPGAGPAPSAVRGGATLMLVGEQPGDQEDRQGKPFVGPAGRVLDQVLEELGIDRSTVYVTNAVKHFKFVQRGKLRLHQNPRMSEITACRPWLLAEIDAVRPKVILCLGASASKSLLGGTFTLMKDHGRVLSTPYADHVVATIHPSAVLRARDQESGDQLYSFLRDDMAVAYRAATQQKAEQPTATAV